MLDIEQIKQAVPVESILCRLIESHTLNVLIDETCTEDEIATSLEAVVLYMYKVNRDIHLRILGDQHRTDYIDTLIKGYNLKDNIHYLDTVDYSNILSYYLGSDVFVTNNPHSTAMELAQNCYLAKLCFRDGGAIFEEGIFYLPERSADLGAMFVLIHEKNDRAELTGHNKLVKSGE